MADMANLVAQYYAEYAPDGRTEDDPRYAQVLNAACVAANQIAGDERWGMYGRQDDGGVPGPHGGQIDFDIVYDSKTQTLYDVFEGDDHHPGWRRDDYRPNPRLFVSPVAGWRPTGVSPTPPSIPTTPVGPDETSSAVLQALLASGVPEGISTLLTTTHALLEASKALSGAMALVSQQVTDETALVSSGLHDLATQVLARVDQRCAELRADLLARLDKGVKVRL